MTCCSQDNDLTPKNRGLMTATFMATIAAAAMLPLTVGYELNEKKPEAAQFIVDVCAAPMSDTSELSMTETIGYFAKKGLVCVVAKGIELTL